MGTRSGASARTAGGGRWLVNGARGPIVSIEIDPPARAHALAFPIRLRELQVSVDDPDAVVATLSP